MTRSKGLQLQDQPADQKRSRVLNLIEVLQQHESCILTDQEDLGPLFSSLPPDALEQVRVHIEQAEPSLWRARLTKVA